jgi:hypothetical protein
MAIRFLLFIDRLYKRLPGDDSAALSTAVSVGGLLSSCWYPWYNEEQDGRTDERTDRQTGVTR